MATRVVVEKICDVCGLIAGEDEGISAVSLTVGKGVYEVDACPKCFDDNPFVKAMRVVKKGKTKALPTTLVDTIVAREPEAPKKAYNIKHGSFPCPQCDFVGKSPNALGAHSKRHKS